MILQKPFLPDKRLAIMTRRRCKPKRMLNVDTPYPRGRGVLAGLRLRELGDGALELVHEESRRAFEAGGKQERQRCFRRERCRP